jgi:UDP-glucose 4-epimerase
VEKLHSIDLTDKEAVAVVFQMYDFDVVFHLAAIAGITDSKRSPFDAIQVNILGTTTVLEAIRLHAPNTQIIYASTVYVHSKHGSIYAATKKCCELLIEKYAEEYNVNYTFLRFGSVYGPGANDFNFVHNILRKAIVGENLIYDGTGDEVREYIHINDAAALAFRVIGS